jgi:LysR family hydrogen peroxide-inducible transcriptional activator
MNIQQLEYIIAVDQFKHFSKAAAHCNITQATLSMMIKKLEEELNVVIFDRKMNPIMTTELGKEIVDEAKKALFHSKEIIALAQSKDHKVEGKLRMGIIPTIANSLLPKILFPLMDAYPLLELELSEITTQNIIRQLKEGTIDVGILSTPLHDEHIEESILYYETLMVYGNLNKDKKYILPEELAKQPLWMLEEGHCMRDQVIQLCQINKGHALPNNLKFQANSFETILNMVDVMGGLTFIPELYYETLSNERKAKVIEFKAPIPVREISMVYYRPFAKLRMIEQLSIDIKEIVNQNLRSNAFKKSELVILEF